MNLAAVQKESAGRFGHPAEIHESKACSRANSDFSSVRPEI